MFDSESRGDKSSRLTMLLVIFSVIAVLGIVTWFFTR